MGGAASVARSRRDEMPLGLERIVLGLSAVLWPNVPVAVPTNLGRALDRHERRSHGDQEAILATVPPLGRLGSDRPGEPTAACRRGQRPVPPFNSPASAWDLIL